MEVDYICGKKTSGVYGIGKYQYEIHKRLPEVNLHRIEYTPILDPIKNRVKGDKTVDQNKAFPTSIKKRRINTSRMLDPFIEHARRTHDILNKIQYIEVVKKNMIRDNITHISHHVYAYLMQFIDFKKTIVTSYDMIPWIMGTDQSILARLSLKGMKKADYILTCAEYSKKDIMAIAEIPAERIKVVYPGVDHEIYKKKRSKDILEEYGIPVESKLVLNVGSETPRQNILNLIRAFAELKKKLPEAKLVKIGRPQRITARERIMQLNRELGIMDDVMFIDSVSEEDLARWYNATDVYVYPGYYAGLSMPLLEAASCGTPLISNPVSITGEKIDYLPEDAEDCGLLVDSSRTNELADALERVLTDESLNKELSEKGLKRARRLSWDRAAKETEEIYELVNSS